MAVVLKYLEKRAKATKEVDNPGRASQARSKNKRGYSAVFKLYKNFSKQAQTMQGGIVAAYATIAAQVFALSAAFQF